MKRGQAEVWKLVGSGSDAQKANRDRGTFLRWRFLLMPNWFRLSRCADDVTVGDERSEGEEGREGRPSAGPQSPRLSPRCARPRAGLAPETGRMSSKGGCPPRGCPPIKGSNKSLQSASNHGNTQRHRIPAQLMGVRPVYK